MASAVTVLDRRAAAIVLLLGVICLLGAAGESAADQLLYADSLAADWQNWSWDSTINLASSLQVHGGSKAISVNLTAAWGGLYLRNDAGMNLYGYDQLRFWLHGGTSGGQQLDLKANSGDAYRITAQANTWTLFNVPLSTLGSPSVLSDLYWQDATGGAQPVFYLDDISLIARTGPPPPPVAGPALSVNAAANRHPISDDIYGMNAAEEPLAAELRLPVNRWGGNGTTRYNWQTSMLNTGSDWYFENLMNGTPDPGRTLPNGSASDLFVEQNRRTGTKSLITVPLIGWTPKAGSPTGHPFDCGFKVAKYGAQASVDPWDDTCGNGLLPDWTTPVTGNSPADTSTAIGPDFVSGWIAHLITNYDTAANGGVTYYALDNEPMLWNSTHRDVHPNPTTYDELRDKTYLYAPAVKAADPSAKIFGPVLWGWCAYLSSAADNCSQGNDFAAHGNTWFVAWYLQQMHAYEQSHGQRILDYLDLHGYPYIDGVALKPAGSAATQAVRLRSTKDLWDPAYMNEGWVGQSVHLIPRMHAWVDSNYPGTKLAITEYNWGGLEHINGALAQADVLGIFGREGLDLATIWGPPTSLQPGAFAFRFYRNYDGAGSGFGEESISAVSADQDKLSIYAAQRNSDEALTLVVINKTFDALASDVGLAGFSAFPWAGVYQYSQADLTAITRMPDQLVSSSGFSAEFPGNSITLLVLSAACSGNQVKLDNAPAASLAAAYQAAGDTATIQMTASQQAGTDFNLIPGKQLLLQGGYNCTFEGTPAFYTLVTGPLTVTTGAVTFDRIVIR